MSKELMGTTILEAAGGRVRADCYRADPPASLDANVVVLTEMVDNPGPSVTNGIEAYTEAVDEWVFSRWMLPRHFEGGYALVEHYLPGRWRPASWSVVEFREGGPDGYADPRWSALADRAEALALVPQGAA